MWELVQEPVPEPLWEPVRVARVIYNDDTCWATEYEDEEPKVPASSRIRSRYIESVDKEECLKIAIDIVSKANEALQLNAVHPSNLKTPKAATTLGNDCKDLTISISSATSSTAVCIVTVGELVGEVPDLHLTKATPGLAMHSLVRAINWSPTKVLEVLQQRGLEAVAWLIAGHSLWDEEFFRQFICSLRGDTPMVVFSCANKINPCMVLQASRHTNVFVCQKEVATTTWACTNILADIGLCVTAAKITSVWCPMFDGLPALKSFVSLKQIQGQELKDIKDELDKARLQLLKKTKRKTWEERREVVVQAGLWDPEVSEEGLRKRFEECEEGLRKRFRGRID